MDFWTRLLVGGSASSPLSKQLPAAQTPEDRLRRFEVTFEQLVDKWRVAPSHPEASSIVALSGCLRRLTTILNEEARAAGADLCREYAAGGQIYVTISKIGGSTHDDTLIQDVVALLRTLVESEEELDFLSEDVFAVSFVQFAQKVVGGAATVTLDVNTQTVVLELLFSISAKIRLHPDILSVWFSNAIGNGKEEQSFAGVTKKEDFPLLYLLLNYIHHEGKIGDFARTGLLYIIECASASEELESWICESDMATLMASGLGALYSQLSRRLYLSYDDEQSLVMAFSDDTFEAIAGAESSASAECKSNVRTFLFHLLFWQDVLEACKSAEVKQTLLDHFHVLFLQQLLYPSILESSDPDGGSAIAILTYLYRMLDVLDHPDLVHLILQYLLALPLDVSSPRTTRRKKSMDLMTMSASIGEIRPVNWFTLADLILLSLKTTNPQVVTASLRLAVVILKKHHRYALNTLVKVSYEFDEESGRTIGASDKEVDFLFNLVEEIGGAENFDELYQSYLEGTQVLVESHKCSEGMLGKTSGQSKFTNSEHKPRELFLHAPYHKDPLVARLCLLLDTFFTNSVQVNLHLTEVIVNLAACGYVRLHGWLVVHYSKYLYSSALQPAAPLTHTKTKETTELFAQEEAQIAANDLARRVPTWQPDSLPPLLQKIRNLCRQAGQLRTAVPGFDGLLIERKQAFQVSDRLSDAAQSAAATSSPSAISAPSPIRPSTFGLISQRLFSPRSTPRAGSPSGRHSVPTLVMTPGKARSTPSPAKLPLAEGVAASGSRSPTQWAGRLASPRINETDLGDLLQGFTEPRKRELRRRIKFPTPGAEGAERSLHIVKSESDLDRTSSDDSDDSDDSDNDTDDDDIAPETRPAARSGRPDTETATVGHVLTNCVVLQHFLLELAALVQVRALTLGDVQYV